MPAPDSSSPFKDAGPFEMHSHGHELIFYPHGQDRLAALLQMIKEAQSSLNIFYYMFQDDVAGGKVRDAIATAAARGVDVHLIVDRFGTDASDEFFDPIKQAGGSIAVFSPGWSRRYLIRNHQKMVIADERTAMVGGFNISDHYFDPPENNGWCDLGCRISGPVVDDLTRWFGQLRDWTAQRKAQFRGIRRLVKDWEPGNGPVRLTLGGPTRAPSNWARMVKRDLVRASRLDLVMAYFSPPLSFRRLIRKIAGRGQVRLVLSGKSDNHTTIAAARVLYGKMLRKGVRIYEFQPSKLHMKLIVVDDAVYFGSANFDHRSIRLNLELMFRFEDAAFAARMREFIDHLEAASLAITPKVHSGRKSLFNEIHWLLSWFLVSTVDYTVSRGLNRDD